MKKHLPTFLLKEVILLSATAFELRRRLEAQRLKELEEQEKQEESIKEKPKKPKKKSSERSDFDDD